ncbi:MAG: hypothetical protein WBC85_10650 [Planktotalea sp.]|uniref:hypothetical protein n=1 Tax=Planktotalea sp. TaxID=2029877 RepID=UPI003C777C04
MATNITKLKSNKGAPPAVDAAPEVILQDTRAEKVAERPLQVRVPVTVFEEFSEQAGREYGFSHGAKKQLFLKMWKAYKAQNM